MVVVVTVVTVVVVIVAMPVIEVTLGVVSCMTHGPKQDSRTGNKSK